MGTVWQELWGGRVVSEEVEERDGRNEGKVGVEGIGVGGEG